MPLRCEEQSRTAGMQKKGPRLCRAAAAAHHQVLAWLISTRRAQVLFTCVVPGVEETRRWLRDVGERRREAAPLMRR